MEVPENMTAQADESQPIPGSEAIPAEMPDAPHGDIPLEYDLQTFNALVAANTAMQTEISSMGALITAKDSEIEHLREVIGDSLNPAITRLKTIVDDQEQQVRKLEKNAESLQSDLNFARDQKEFAEKRLERALGYLDATLDREDSFEAPATQTVPATRPTRGPNLDSMERPVRRDMHNRTDMAFAYGTPVEALVPGQGRRRYD